MEHLYMFFPPFKWFKALFANVVMDVSLIIISLRVFND